MNKTRCLIVDDEVPARDLIQNYVSMVDRLELVDTAASAVKAFDLLKEKDIDLIFLDIQMPVLNGIDFIKALKNPPAVILTTAYREYALDGYDLDIIDYLLKPIAFDRFLKAVDRYFSKRAPTFTPPVEKKAEPEFIYFNINRKKQKITLDDILYIESLKDYVRIHTKDEAYVTKGNIGSILTQLPEDIFIRIHRSYGISRKHIDSFNQKEVTVGGKSLPIGVRYRGVELI